LYVEVNETATFLYKTFLFYNLTVKNLLLKQKMDAKSFKYLLGEIKSRY
jgi:hypothetical protein